MLADDAAGILAGRSGFGAEARRISGERDGEAGFFEDFVAVEVGDGDFGGGDEPVVVILEFAAADGLRIGVGAAEEILGELGQLAGAEEALAVDHEGRQDFGIAVLPGVQVEHEGDEGALEAGACAHVNRKARARELGGAFQVEDAEGFAEFPVRLWKKIKNWLLAPDLNRFVILIRFTNWNFIANKVGNARQRQIHLLIETRCSGVKLVEPFLELFGFVHQHFHLGFKLILLGFKLILLRSQIVSSR